MNDGLNFNIVSKPYEIYCEIANFQTILPTQCYGLKKHDNHQNYLVK